MKYLFKKSVLGGTFDHLHLGHQKLINTAFEQAEQVTIGLTKPNMYQHKAFSETIEPYEVRETHLKKFLTDKNFLDRAHILPITNIFGNTLDHQDIEAIFVTEENIPNVHKINEKRREIGFPDLTSIVVEYVNDDNGEHITSERIRKGEIDKHGFVYKNLFKETLQLSEEIRSRLRTPMGEVLKTTEAVIAMLHEDTFVIAVGDIIVHSLIEKNVIPAVSVIDYKTRRESIENSDQETQEKVLNEQGTINKGAVEAIQEKINQYYQTNHPQTLVINGEEDLLALPAILLAPLNTLVLYGQFDQGVVVNHVTERVKRNARNFLI